MTQTPTPEFVQSLIVLANSRKEVFAAALANARDSLEATTQTPGQLHVPTPAGQRTTAGAERIDWIISAL